jgi:DNA-binding response OmpR family regulator
MTGAEATDDRALVARAGDPVPATVLVVDDEPAIRRFVSRTIARDAFRIVEAGDGRSAIAAVEVDPARLILVVCDLSLPDVGGEEVIRVARALRPGLPVVVMTGWDPGSTADVLDASGHVVWLAKPFTAAQLRAAVDATLLRP